MNAPVSRADAAGAVVLAAAACCAIGGAAASPHGVLLGVPGWAAVGVVLAAGAGVLLVAARTEGRLSAALGLVPLLFLLAAGLRIPGLAALSGRGMAPIVLAVLAAVLSAARPAWSRTVFFPAVLVLYLLIAARVQHQVGPNGDEPHYLMVAESLWRDHDLSLEADYAEGRYRAFYDGPLAPHYRVRGRNGAIYSLHAVGLSILILPAWIIAGYPGVSFFMALLAAVLAREIRELVRSWTEEDPLAEGVGWLVALGPPLVHYAGLVFTEVPAALIVAAALRRGTGTAALGTRQAAVLGTAIAVLPWLNVRYAPLAVLVLAFVLWTRPTLRTGAALVLPTVASAVGIAFYHFVLYGFFDPRRVYGRRPELSLAVVPEGLPGLFLDQEYGLLAYAPVFALAIPGFFHVWRKDARRGAVLLALVAVVLGTASTWPMWRGGWNPPARFLVPVVPVLAAALAARLRRGMTVGAMLLIGWTLWTGLLGSWEPRLVHRDRDETAPFFRRHSGAEEWTRLLPGFVLADRDRFRLSAVWIVALAAAVLARPRALTAPRLAVGSLGLLAAAGAASALAHGRTGDRDAVRVLGQPALQVPGWRWRGSAVGEWGPSALEWGPAYEPHRHPGGAEIGHRLALPSGRYRVRLEGDDLDLASAPAQLEARPDGVPEGTFSALERVAGGWEGTFTVAEGVRPLTLLLRDGGAFVLKAIILEVQPSGAAAGLNQTEGTGSQ
jgi:hypothetical protein